MVFKATAMDEVDAGRDRATPASVRHDDDEALAPISPCYSTRAARPAHFPVGRVRGSVCVFIVYVMNMLDREAREGE
jgi:hypothetical protein